MLETKIGGTGNEVETGLIRELLSMAPSPEEVNVVADRARYDAAEHEFLLPPHLGISHILLGGVPCELIGAAPASDVPSRSLIIYLHGGGYALGSSRSHRHLAGAIAESCGIPVVVPNYSLAPERSCPAAVDDTIRVVLEILKASPSTTLALVGDSAGGGLAVATAVSLRGRVGAVKAIVCLSPWLDLTCSRPAYSTQPSKDPSLTPGRLRSFAAWYVGRLNPHDPRASPLFADVQGLPPILVHVAEGEFFEDEAHEFASIIAGSGGHITVEVWQNVMHVWHWYWPILSAGREAIGKIGTFLRIHLTPDAS